MNCMLFMLTNNILPTPPTGTLSDIASAGITFFSTWIARIGGLIAFIGAVKFAISIKSDDAKEQLQTLAIMVSGFMIASAVHSTLFNIPTVYSEAAANAEFAMLLRFISKWVRRVGAAGFFIGSLSFGFSIKDNNAAVKVTSLKTLTAGALIMALSAVIKTFAYI